MFCDTMPFPSTTDIAALILAYLYLANVHLINTTETVYRVQAE